MCVDLFGVFLLLFFPPESCTAAVPLWLCRMNRGIRHVSTHLPLTFMRMVCIAFDAFFFLMRVCEYSGCATVFLFLFVCLKSHDIITAITFVPLFVANMDLVFRIYEAHAHLRSHVYFCRVMCFSYIDLA